MWSKTHKSGNEILPERSVFYAWIYILALRPENPKWFLMMMMNENFTFLPFFSLSHLLSRHSHSRKRKGEGTKGKKEHDIDNFLDSLFFEAIASVCCFCCSFIQLLSSVVDGSGFFTEIFFESGFSIFITRNNDKRKLVRFGEF